MEESLNVNRLLNQWIKKVILTFFLCAIIILCVSMIVKYYSVPEKYMIFSLLLCSIFYLYQILLIIKIKCPNCNKPLIISLFSGSLSLDLRSYLFKKCKNCGKMFL